MRERRLQRGMVIALVLLLIVMPMPGLAEPAPLPEGQYNLTNIFFLHHSTGEGIIVEGNMRAYFNNYNSTHGTNYEFWDHGYNEEGLRDPAGNRAGCYDIPDDNTDPPGLHHLWTTDNGARRQIMANHEVIAFKSCFPASYIPDEGTLNQYKSWYLEMRDYFDQHPEKLFVVMSPPPLNRFETDPAAAKNARRFANWLKSSEYLDGHPNIVCFDLFNELAQPDDGTATANMLRYEYELDHSGCDSHPNTLANQTVGPVFAQFLIDAARNYATLIPVPLPEQAVQVPTPAEPTPPPEEATQPPGPTLEPTTWPSPVVGIIVDNTDPGFTIEAGDWGTCEDGACSGVPYGADFRFADPGCSSCRARFDFNVPTAGEYDVWTWWPWGEDRATDTPFTIIYSGGPFTVNVDQRNSGDAWWWLATLAFEAGESASIVVEGSATGYANADAIALTAAGSGPPSGPAAEQPVQVPTPAVRTAGPLSTTGGEKVICDIDADMKAHLQSIMATGQARGRRINVFAKIGDSITESMAFLNDYCCGWYDLGPHTELEEVIQYFAAAHADELEAQVNPYHTSFDRMSLVAVSGAHAAYMLEGGANSSLMQEVNAIQPGLAIIMFGTNETLAGEDVATYKANLRQIVTILKEEGVIPILSTIPDLVPPAEGGERIPAFNQAIKEVALEEQVPLMDYWQALQSLPNKGLDADGIHPNVFMEGGEYRSGDLTPEGLQYGFNVRNKLALEMLLKLKRVVIDDGPPDASGPSGAVPPTEPPVVSPVEPPATGMPPGAGGIRHFPDTSDGIYVFNDQLAGWSMTEEQFQFAATHYVGCQKMIRDHTRHLRQYNPGFIMLHYRLGLGLGYQRPDAACQPNGNWLQIIEGDEWVQEWPGDEVAEDGWFFPWAGQPRVYNCDWGWYVMELNDPSWRAWWSNKVIGQIAANEADGLFADSFLMPNYLGADRYRPSLPEVDTAFEEAWATRIEDFITYLQGQFGDYYLIPNVGQWVTTRDPTDYSDVDGVMIEGFSEWEPQNPFELMDWQLQMNRILALTRQDRIIIAQSYLWDPGDVETRLFYLGSYLLVKGRHSYINIEYSIEPEYFPEYDLELGQPLDPLPTEIDGYFNASWGVYSRRYTNGLVFVNPGTNTHRIDLGGTYYLAQPSGGGLVPADGDISAWVVDYTPVTQLDLVPNQAAVLLITAP